MYMVVCSDGTYYTGVTTDLIRRVAEHNGEAGVGKGAKYTKPRRPVRLVYSEEVDNRSQAQSRESIVRQLSRMEKHELAISGKV
ncbi:MAG: hypothetical protein RLZZ70_334 [Candidatus Parcubacteria bacterium]